MDDARLGIVHRVINETILFDDGRNDTGANGSAAFTDSEAETFFINYRYIIYLQVLYSMVA